MALDKFGRHIHHKDPYFETFYDEDDYEYYDVQYRRLINVGTPLGGTDAVNKQFLNNELNKISYRLFEHQIAANTNVKTANQIVVDIQAEIDHLYSALKLTKPAASVTVVQSKPELEEEEVLYSDEKNRQSKQEEKPDDDKNKTKSSGQQQQQSDQEPDSKRTT